VAFYGKEKNQAKGKNPEKVGLYLSNLKILDLL